ncbi:hypothetical protein L195_g005860 [Trifolium pratense]|uniref:Uncharacterized protein n=1 Tax=Trifolium pratense TaxID=57577 RepID=A0A2K3P1Z8_TRIPR|nr:hypothetical protein L195_g005860 [Trifolium pratense]
MIGASKSKRTQNSSDTVFRNRSDRTSSVAIQSNSRTKQTTETLVVVEGKHLSLAEHVTNNTEWSGGRNNSKLTDVVGAVKSGSKPTIHTKDRWIQHQPNRTSCWE